MSAEVAMELSQFDRVNGGKRTGALSRYYSNACSDLFIITIHIDTVPSTSSLLRSHLSAIKTRLDDQTRQTDS